MIPRYPEFKQLNVDDRKVLDGYIGMYGLPICEHSFATLSIWQDFHRASYTIINDSLCIFIEPLNEPPFFLEPMGRIVDIDAIRTCFDHAGCISRATSSFVSKLPKDSIALKMLPDHFDYIYRTSVLAELSGRQFDGKRNHINNFARHYPQYSYSSISEKDAGAAFSVFNRWVEGRSGKGGEEFSKQANDAQYCALERSFKNFPKLGLEGGAIHVNGEILGFIIGSRLNSEMASIHFLYFYPGVRGLSQTILWEACRRTFSPYNYINLEQDLGISGLRKMKMSYHPVRIEEKFHVMPS